jgi:hypothetical protein
VKPSTAAVKNSLKQLTQGLTFTEYGGINHFIWEVEEKGKFGIKELLLSNFIWGNPSLKLISGDVLKDFLRGAEYDSRLSEFDITLLLTILQSSLSELKCYRAYFPDSVFEIYIGNIQDTCFGLISPIDYDKHGTGKRFRDGASLRLLESRNLESNSYILELINQLEANRFSRQNGFIWEVGEDDDNVLERLLAPSKFLVIQNYVSIQNLAKQFDPELRNIEEERSIYDTEVDYVDPETGLEFELEVTASGSAPSYPTAKNYRDLDTFLQSHLSNLQVYAVGATASTEFNMYVIGTMLDGDLAGVLLHCVDK